MSHFSIPSKHSDGLTWAIFCKISIIILVVAIAGCKVDLYNDISEKEANEMIALLLSDGIGCDRMPGNEGLWIVRTDKKHLARAVTILKDNGYPKDKFDSMGDVFKKEGLVTSPLEDRIRFIYALSQELSQTISYIDGILTARVHVVLPENNPNTYIEKIQPSSAAVFIKYQDTVDISARIPLIKELVVNSIEGLTYDKVTLALFPTTSKAASSVSTNKARSGGPWWKSLSLKRVTLYAFILSSLITAFLGFRVLLLRKPHLVPATIQKLLIKIPVGTKNKKPYRKEDFV